MNKVKVKVMPAETHIKVQYEGEELTIKELVSKLEYLKGSHDYLKWVVVEKEKEIALLKKQLADVQPVRHGRWITVVETNGKEYPKCANCQMELDGLEDAYSFCPYCGAKMDGKDINVPTKSGMEEEYDG